MISDTFTNNSDKQLANIPLHDIQGLVEVSDYSLYYFLLLVSVSLFLVAALGYFLWKYLRTRNKENFRKVAFEALQNVDLASAKQASYDITRLGAIFKEDSERLGNKYNDVVEKLERYKYKKEVQKSLDEASVAEYKIFLDMIEV